VGGGLGYLHRTSQTDQQSSKVKLKQRSREDNLEPGTFSLRLESKTILSATLFQSAFNVAPDFIPSTESAVWMVSIVALAVIVADKMWQKTGRMDETRTSH
jgi:hypothetical protein